MEQINEVISFPLLFEMHKSCNISIKKLKKKNDKLLDNKKKVDHLLNVLGINDIDNIYDFIVNKINKLLQQNIEKDEMIQEYRKQEEKINDKLYSWGFISLDELNVFINKYKYHKCIYEKSNIDDIITDYNLSIYNKNVKINNNERILEFDKIKNEKYLIRFKDIIYKDIENRKKEKDERILKNKNKVKLIFNKIILFIKIKKFLRKNKKGKNMKSVDVINNEIVNNIITVMNIYKKIHLI